MIVQAHHSCAEIPGSFAETAHHTTWFKCRDCDAIYSSLAYLNSHVLRRHDGVIKVSHEAAVVLLDNGRKRQATGANEVSHEAAVVLLDNGRKRQATGANEYRSKKPRLALPALTSLAADIMALDEHDALTKWTTDAEACFVSSATVTITVKRSDDPACKLRLTCAACGEHCAGVVRLRHHITRRHPYSVAFRCDACDVVLDSKRGLYHHMALCHIKRPFMCTLCPFTARWHHHLQYHIREVHERVPEKHPCTECDKVYNGRRTMLRHYNMVHLGIRWSCPVCNFVFSMRHDALKHIKAHVPDMRYCCPYCCDGPFNATRRLNEHVAYWHSAAGRPYKCTLCSGSCNTAKEFDRHAAMHAASKKKTASAALEDLDNVLVPLKVLMEEEN